MVNILKSSGVALERPSATAWLRACLKPCLESHDVCSVLDDLQLTGVNIHIPVLALTHNE